jgi:FkbM family methyltransferase
MSSARSERQDLVLNVRGGARLCVPEDFSHITPYVLLEQEDWFEHEIRFVRRWLQPGMKAVDVGANYGVYSLAAARAVGREGRVWAFEPTPAIAGYLERSIGLNDGVAVKLERVAVSDRAGEVPFVLTRVPEQNAVAANREVPGAVGIPAVRLDDLAGEWGEVDFLKLDVEGHEAQAIRGAESFLATCSPLVMLEIRAARTFDFSAAQQLAALGYSMYRLLPGPLVLVPFDEEEDFDKSLLNVFLCKDDRAARLAAGGFLSDGADVRQGTSSPEDWSAYARSTPYARTLGARWRAKPGLFASSSDKIYHEGLAAFARSRDPGQRAEARVAALMHASTCVAQAMEDDISLSKQLSYARIAWELGRREATLETLSMASLRVEEEWRQALEEPFLAPEPRYDAVACEEGADDWLCCAIVEQVEKVRAYSSLYTRTTVAEVLRTIMARPYRSAQMDRRWQLARMAEGAAREHVPALCAGSEENLNPGYWCPAGA